MSLKLKYSSLQTGSYSIIHNGDEYPIDPILFLKYSRRFGTLFNFAENHVAVNDDYDKHTFELFVKACQCQPFEISGNDCINLLLLAEYWESATLVKKIEKIIKDTIPAKDILEMYIKFQGTEFPIERLEKIMIACLPEYIVEPLFPTLPFEVIDRVVHESKAQISPTQIVKLCLAVAEVHGLKSVHVFSHTCFDDIPSDELMDVSEIFRNCEDKQLSQFFQAMGRLLYQVSNGAESATQFEVSWRSGETGTWNQAFDFYNYVTEYKKKHVTADTPNAAAKKQGESTTSTAFLKIAADKGNYTAQYQYSKYLFRKAATSEERQVALNYMIQAAAESNSEAITALKTMYPISEVASNMKIYVYSTMTLQNLLLNLNPRNFDNVKTAIFALLFGTERNGITALTSNILRAVVVRQRLIPLYADLVKYLISVASETNNYALLKGSIYTKVMETLLTDSPRVKQFALMRFLYLCSRKEIYKDDELAESISQFMHEQKHLTQSNLIIFYYFAPLLERFERDLYKQMYLTRFDGGMGCLDKMIADFKDNIVMLRLNDWANFYTTREDALYATELGYAIAHDDLGKFQQLTSKEDFNLTQKIMNDAYDLEGSEKVTVLQYSCLQGSQIIFTYLLQRGLVKTSGMDNTTITCAVIGGKDFIENFIVNQMKNKNDLFRIAARYQNVEVLSRFFKSGFDFSSVDEIGRTALHHATQMGLPDVVKILLSLDGMDLNRKDKDGLTALHIAAKNNDLDIVKILSVCRGIALDCRTNNNELPFDLAESPDVKAILKKK